MDETQNIESADNKDLIIFRAIELMIDNLKKNVEHMRKHHEYVIAVRDRLLDDIKNERRIFILASGRSAMVGQMFQTRLEHLGAESRFITNSRSVPRVKEGETIVVISGSGTTPIVKAVLETYLIWNPYVIVITSYPLSVIGRLGDVTVKLIGRTKTDLARREIGLDSTLTPEGTMFESAALSFLDGIVAELAIALNLTEESMFDKHNQGI
ncbi:MAG: SIS domain-containing protein [Candidatus Heimdallarchaeum endolithica]|uniref:SIS domain-containing protein n=1 Tax=Candidatus Heimdallarchaeum endolithica TaxID=2876572 RepID=A0A9Y1BSV4_9ARCH|nr:MAG: SIS domain-containing protein [Candidatus Heimdallarchaeum endolithica]